MLIPIFQMGSVAVTYIPNRFKAFGNLEIAMAEFLRNS